MGRPSRRKVSHRLNVKRKGGGIINTLINKLPFELHIPTYQFCGPGTKLHQRVLRGDRGVNKLDESCRSHDLAYSQSKDISERHKADRILGAEAWKRFRSEDASIGEKASALAIAGIMKAKVKLGAGRGRRKRGGAISFRQAVGVAKKKLGGKLKSNLERSIQLALSSLRNKHIRPPSQRIIPIPKRGGFLPLIPLFAALGALGSVGGGAAAIAKTVTDAKNAARTLEENKRHNKAMEGTVIGKGLYVSPYKKGLGLYLTPPKKNLN